MDNLRVVFFSCKERTVAIIATKNKKTGGTRKELPKKICPVCKKEKTISKGFYKSASPLYADEGCVPICIDCVKDSVVNDDGTINLKKLKSVCRKLDKPLYFDALESAYAQYRREHSYTPEEEVAKQGRDIIALFFKNTASLRQYIGKDYEASEKDNHIIQGNSTSKSDKEILLKKYSGLLEVQPEEKTTEIVEPKVKVDVVNYDTTDEDIQLFGEGFTNTEYRKMRKKYDNLKLNYSLQTNLHQEALATYVRFKVKEEDATARGDVDEAKKWYDAAQNAAANGKLTPKQLSEADLQGGINSFSEIFKAVEQAVDVIPILPRFKYRPNDALDFNIWCYINYARDLQGLPQCEYEDVYKFYDKKKQEYLEQYGDPYGIFDDEPDESIRENIKKFITLPKDYEDGDS